jgi:choline dehydrogenase-like flavoprotein
VLRRPLRTLKALKGISLRRFLQQMAHQNDLMFAIAVQQAEARGNITIVSADPNVQPRIDYNYLDNESDLRRMREVVRTSVASHRSVMTHEAICMPAETSELRPASLTNRSSPPTSVRRFSRTLECYGSPA